MKRIAILEDHEILRNLTCEYLLTKIQAKIDTFSNSKDLIAAIDDNVEYDILIIDLALEDGENFAIFDKKKTIINCKYIVHTSNKDTGIINYCMELGAEAIVSKSSNEEELLNAINSVIDNVNYYCPIIKTILKNARSDFYSSEAPERELSKREREILNLVWNNYSTKEIAKTLYISHYTVETHRKSIMKKFGSNSLVETLRIGLKKGYIDTLMN